MPSCRWDVLLYAATLISPEPVFGRDPEGYNALTIPGAYLDDLLHRHRSFPEDATVETETIRLDTVLPDGTTYRDGEERELVHGVKLRFVLVTEGDVPTRHDWHPFNLKHLDKAMDAA